MRAHSLISKKIGGLAQKPFMCKLSWSGPRKHFAFDLFARGK